MLGLLKQQIHWERKSVSLQEFQENVRLVPLWRTKSSNFMSWSYLSVGYVKEYLLTNFFWPFFMDFLSLLKSDHWYKEKLDPFDTFWRWAFGKKSFFKRKYKCWFNQETLCEHLSKYIVGCRSVVQLRGPVPGLRQ